MKSLTCNDYSAPDLSVLDISGADSIMASTGFELVSPSEDEDYVC